MTAPTAGASHLHGAVVHVRDLDRSVEFYSVLFVLDVAQREANAVVLTGPDGQFEIALCQRAAAQPLGGLGVQALVWRLATPQALAEYEERLIGLTDRVTRRDHPPVAIVTAHDPDGQRLLLIGPTTAALGEPDHIPLEVFTWE